MARCRPLVEWGWKSAQTQPRRDLLGWLRWHKAFVLGPKLARVLGRPEREQLATQPGRRAPA
jgi:hypothetical protein